MSKVLHWKCPCCGIDRTVLHGLLDGQACIQLSCHKDCDNGHYMLVIDPVKCLGCHIGLACIKALIIKEEDFGNGKEY